jgi:nucleotide-binding universal stress UspA family protein
MKKEIRKILFKSLVVNAIVVETALYQTEHEEVLGWLDEVKNEYLKEIKKESERAGVEYHEFPSKKESGYHK